MKSLARLSFVALAGLASLCTAAVAADAPAPESTLTLGAGVGVAPAYAGSKKNKAVALPLLDYQHSSGLFASTQRGLGWAGGNDSLQYSLAVNGRAERSDEDHKAFDFKTGSSELAGMGKIKASAVAQGTVTYRLGDRASLRAAVEVPLTQRDNGSTVQVGGDYTLWRATRDSVSLSGTLGVADGKYMRTYFGVTPAQSANSGYAAYAPKAGLYKANLNLGWTHRIDEHWNVVATAGVDRLMGDAGKSPLALRKTAPQGGVLVSYTY